MNPLSYDVELMALAVLLFLYDSSALLYANEALLTCNERDRWRALFGWTRFVLSGRTLAVLNPFSVGQPAFRLSWQLEAPEAAGSDTGWESIARRLTALRWWARGAWCGLFVALPLGLFTPAGAPAVWMAVVLSYGSAIGGAVHLGALREALSLTGRAYALLAFEAIICPPFAANAVRRVALRQRVTESFPHAAGRLLRGEERAAARLQCEARLADEIAAAPATATAGLQARQAQVTEWLAGS